MQPIAKALPLPRPGFGSDTLGSLHLVVVSLGHGSIGLVATGGAGTLILVENSCWGL